MSSHSGLQFAVYMVSFTNWLCQLLMLRGYARGTLQQSEPFLGYLGPPRPCVLIAPVSVFLASSVQRSRKKRRPLGKCAWRANNLLGPNSTMVPPLQMAKKVRLRYDRSVSQNLSNSSRFVDVSVQIGWLGSLAWLQEGWQTNPKMLRQTKPRLAMQKVDENGPW